MDRPTLSDVSSQYGAPMGRPDSLPDDTSEPVALYLQPLQWVDGDYDQGGAYWGHNPGDSIFWAHGDGEDVEVDIFTRATSRDEAERYVLSSLPAARFQEEAAAYLDDFVDAYVECALWSSTDDDCEPLDGLYSADDLAPDALAEIRDDCADFVAAQWAALQVANAQYGRGAESCGHDFWLTRNGHGAGFWDRGMGQLGDDLSDACEPYGGCDLYVGDDGLLYIM